MHTGLTIIVCRSASCENNNQYNYEKKTAIQVNDVSICHFFSKDQPRLPRESRERGCTLAEISSPLLASLCFAALGNHYHQINESTEVHNPRRDCAILTLAHETHQTDVMPSIIRVKFDVMHKRRG